MSEPELAFESGLGRWVGFKHSEMRGEENLGRKKKGEHLWPVWFYSYSYAHIIQNILEALKPNRIWLLRLRN